MVVENTTSIIGDFQMNICYFGSYDPKYSRNRIIIKGLKQNDVGVVECQDASLFWLRCLKLLWKYFKVNKHDVIIVGAQGHANVPLAKILSKLYERKIIFDPFISLYDTAVFDRKEVKKSSIKAKYYYYLDKISCKLADVIVADTKEHFRYFHEEFGIPKSKMRVVYVGSDDDIFSPRKYVRKNSNFTIYFYGTFIPLHGIQYIIRAAKLLEKERDIIFKIIGRGQTYNQILELSRKLDIRNVSFLNSVKYEELPEHLSKADVCLGIFGDSEKAKRAIPNKVYDALAMKKPIITGDSPAIREILTDRKEVLLCKTANPEALADAILTLREDEKLRKKITENGYKLYKQRFTPEEIGNEMKKVIDELV